jgi:hypothetical protein
MRAAPQDRGSPRDLHFAVAVAAIAAALPLAAILGLIGEHPRLAMSPPFIRAFVASLGIGALVVLVLPAARRLAGLATLNLAFLLIVALAGGTLVPDPPGATSSGWTVAQEWSVAIVHALLGTAAIVGVGVWRKEHALRCHRLDRAGQRLPAIADGQRLLGILMRASWIALCLATAGIIAALPADAVAARIWAFSTLGSIAILVTISRVLVLDLVRGVSAGHLARSAVIVYVTLLITRLGG